MDREAAEAIFWLVSSARAPRLATAESTALELDTDGVNEALAPEALTVLGEALLLADADWADASRGFDRAALLPSADCAADRALAEVIFWLVSARASLLSTREVAAETEGASELLAPVALTALGSLALAAVADCEEAFCGVLRAALIPPAGCATDCVDAARIVWLVSARASPLSTGEAACETDGENELLAPAAPTALGALALAAVADCAAASCGVLRSAFAPDADCAAGCAEAAAMGVSRMDARISWLICCTADSSPFSARVSTLWLPPVRLVPVMTQFFS
jgi:hypothetical protein